VPPHEGFQKRGEMTYVLVYWGGKEEKVTLITALWGKGSERCGKGKRGKIKSISL